MYMRSDEKLRGFDNFCGTMASKPMRRNFLADATAKKLSPSSGLNAYYFHYDKPSKPLVVGLIGAGRQGVRLLAAMNPAYLTVKAIADIRPSSQTAAVVALVGNGDAGKWKTADDVKKDVKLYDGYQKLIDAAKGDGVQAVIIALPSYLHAPASLAAMKAGLHVLVETPFALSVADAKAMVQAARKDKLCLAVAQQRRYSVVYDNALEMVRAGLLSEVHYVRAQWHVPLGGGKDMDWCKAIPENAKVNSEEMWQIFQKFSGGLIAELGSQLFDAASMFLAEIPNRDPQKPHPLSVAGSASQVLANMGDIDDHIHCVFEYAAKDYVDKGPQKTRKKIGLQFDLIVGNEFDFYGETILGTQGSLILEAEKRGMLFQKDNIDKRVRVLPKKDDKSSPVLEIPKDGGRGGDEESEALGRLALIGIDTGLAAELEHWAFCCLNPGEKNKPHGDADTALATTVMAVAASKAIELGTRVDFQDAWFDAEKNDTPDDLKA